MNHTFNKCPYIIFLICVFCISLYFSGVSQIAPEFNPIPTSFNVDSPYPVYALDIAYDSTDMNAQRFHLFLPDSVGNFPLVRTWWWIYFKFTRYRIVKCRTNAGHQILSRKWDCICQHRIPSNQLMAPIMRVLLNV